MPTLRLYGPATLTSDDGAGIALAAREAALLAWLHLEGPTSCARLAALLWSSGDESRGRTNLRQTLARLRRGAGDVLAEDDGILALAPGVQARSAEGGQLLAGLHFDDADELAHWLATRRDDARRAQQRNALAAAQQSLAGGDLDHALAQADALLAAEPESEQAWRIRMEALYLAGDRAATIAAWDECRAALRRAFGVAPSQASNELGRLIMDSAPSAGAGKAAPPAAAHRACRRAGRDRALPATAPRRGDRRAGRHRQEPAAGGGRGRACAVAARGRAARRRRAARLVLCAPAARGAAAFAPPLDEPTPTALAALLPADGAAPVALKSSLEHRHVLRSAARALHACAQAGLRVLAIDDLQYADDAGVAAMQVLVGAWIANEDDAQGQPARAALLPVFSVRDGELSAAWHGLLTLLAGSRRSARFDLAPLTLDDVTALLAALPLPDALGAHRTALAQALLARVSGNPAYLIESLKSPWLEELDGLGGWQPGQALPVPTSPRDSVRQRLERLPSESMQLAQLAAVVGRDVLLGLAASSLGCAPLGLAPVLASLQAAQVFDCQGPAHDLVAEAIRHSVPPLLIESLHKLAAGHLIAQAGAPASVAHHLEAAGERQAAGPWHLQAGQRAAAQRQWTASARSYEAAAAVIDGRRERAQAFRAWHGAGTGWMMAGRNEEAMRCLNAAEALVREPTERVLLLTREATLLNNADRYAEAAPMAREAARQVPALVDALDDDALAQALTCVSLSLPYVEDPAEALPPVRLPAAGRRPLGPPAGAHRSGAGHGAALARPPEGGLAGAAGGARPHRRWQCADRGGEPRQPAAARLRVDWHGGPCRRGGRGHAPSGARRRARPAVRARPAPHHGGLLQVVAGQPGPGLHAMAAADALLGDGAQRGFYYAMRSAIAQRLLGAPEAARAQLLALEPPGGALVARASWCALRARLAASADEPWQSWLDEATRCCACPNGMLALRLRVLALALAPQSPVGATAALLAELAARGTWCAGPAAAGAWRRGPLAAGDTQAAVAQARAALALADRTDPWLDDPATVWLDAGEVLREAGEPLAAAAALAAGAQWVTEAARTLDDPATRRRWCEANPVHRALLAAARA